MNAIRRGILVPTLLFYLNSSDSIEDDRLLFFGEINKKNRYMCAHCTGG